MPEQTVGTHDLIDLKLMLEWESVSGHHREIRHFYDYNVWRDLDLLPIDLQQEVLHQPTGHSSQIRLAEADTIPSRQESLVHRTRRENFHGQFRGREIEPQLGRFYPQGMVGNLPGVFPDGVLPLRILDSDEQYLTCDLNHPLAGHELTLMATVGEIHGAPPEHGGRCQDALAQLLHGPGMQVRFGNQPTDFFSGNPFQRLDGNTDDIFYSMSRLTDHLDARALEEVSKLHGELIPHRGRILDLMASVNSHLPDSLQPTELIGLGMNEEELAANRLLSKYLVHDLNLEPNLPFPDNAFDAVTCTVSVEYLIRPLEVFNEVLRILKPGGVFINSFSNRWFPPKVISLWIDLHEFERMGLVSEYYLRTDGFGKIFTWSQQGLKRPEADKYGSQLSLSDPLYAVWSHKVSK